MKPFCLTLTSILFAAAAPCLAQSDSAEVERGRQLYMSNGCFSCHGTVGQGGERSSAPKLAPQPYPFEAFAQMVRQPREAMPRYEARFVSDEQLLSMHRYLASIATGPSAKDIPQLQIGSR